MNNKYAKGGYMLRRIAKVILHEGFEGTIAQIAQGFLWLSEASIFVIMDFGKLYWRTRYAHP